MPGIVGVLNVLPTPDEIEDHSARETFREELDPKEFKLRRKTRPDLRY